MLITQYAALSKNGLDWTRAFGTAVEYLARQGGGLLEIPAGEYKTYPVKLRSNIELHIHENAVLSFFDDPGCFPVIDAEFEGIPGEMYMPCVFADNAENVKVTGKGVINGNGGRWWKALKEKKLGHHRPYLVCFRHCKNVLLEGVTLINSPVWTVHPQYCEDVVIRGVTIVNPPDSPNTDGIDPNSCSRVRIENCVIDVGDDCIAIKSGTEDTPVRRPCEDIVITGCRMLHGHGGVVIGSEMSGSVTNVTVSDCVFRDTDRGIRLKTRRRRGGIVSGLVFRNIDMDGVMCPFVLNMYYFCGKDGKLKHVWDKAPYPVDEGTPTLRGIEISGITAKNCSACAGFFYGLAEMPIEDVTLRDIEVTMTKSGPAACPAMMDGCPEMRANGFFMRNVRGLRFENVRVNGVEGPLADKDETVMMSEA